MFGSGLPTSEKPTGKKFYLMSHGPNASSQDAWLAYNEFVRRTSILIPLPPMLYSLFPAFVKKTVLLDFPFYQFDEARDGPKAVKEATENQA